MSEDPAKHVSSPPPIRMDPSEPTPLKGDINELARVTWEGIVTKPEKRSPRVEIQHTRTVPTIERTLKQDHNGLGLVGQSRVHRVLLVASALFTAIALTSIAVIQNRNRTNETIQDSVALVVDEELQVVQGASPKVLAQATVKIVDLDSTNPSCISSGYMVNQFGTTFTAASAIEAREACEYANVGVIVTTADDTPQEIKYVANVSRVDLALDMAILSLEGTYSSELQGIDPDGMIEANFAAVPLTHNPSFAVGDKLTVYGYIDALTPPKRLPATVYVSRVGEGVPVLAETEIPVPESMLGGLVADPNGLGVGVMVPCSASNFWANLQAADSTQDEDSDGRPVGDLCEESDESKVLITSVEDVLTMIPDQDPTREVLPSVVPLVNIYNPRFSSGESNNSPVNNIVVAKAGLNLLCLFVDWTGIPNGTRYDGLWFRDGQWIQGLSKVNQVWQWGDQGKNFWMCAIDGRGLEAGEYEAALFLNNELVYVEAIRLLEHSNDDEKPVTYRVSWINGTDEDLCGLAVNIKTNNQHVGANELRVGQRLLPGAALVMQLPAGPVVAEAYDCSGKPIADTGIDGAVVDGEVTFNIVHPTG